MISDMIQILLVVSALAAVTVSAPADLCQLESCNCRKHINCDQTSETLSPSCPPGAKLMDTDEHIKTEVLRIHNKLRNLIASGNFQKFPPAVYMSTMQWHEELAGLARKNVMRCKLGYDDCRNTKDLHFVGQLLGRYEYSQVLHYQHIYMIDTIIELWFSEHKYATDIHFDNYPVTMKRGRDIRHFCQVSKDDATHVGCAGLDYTENGNTTFIFCCNYNQRCVPGYSIYDHNGGPAAMCDTGRNPAYTNMCNVEETYTSKINDYNHYHKGKVEDDG